MREEAMSRGVQFKNVLVEELNFDSASSGRCTGVSTPEGVICCSEKIIVAAGAWTERLLAKYKIPLGIRSYPLATEVCVVHFTLYGEELEQFKQNPIFSYHRHGECLYLHRAYYA
jgi:glycine/D-amino acid oxidase-like deaminating enzyme